MTTLRPILFSGRLVNAILAGKKTETRRILRPQPGPTDATARASFVMFSSDKSLAGRFQIQQADPNGETFTGQGRREREVWRGRCPYGRGDGLLWVRETWAPVEAYRGIDPGSAALGSGYFYRADDSVETVRMAGEPESIDRWRPSIHMPREASRLVLQIREIRIERLHDIDEAGIRAEGFDGTREEFGRGWDTINAKRGPWSSNPWVWVVTFERLLGGAGCAEEAARIARSKP